MKFLRLKKAEVVQPNKPKPTTVLPQNMEWSWDPEAADWVAVMKDNTNVTPPLYNPQNQNVVNTNATTYMSSVKSSSKFPDEDTPEYEKRVQEAYEQLAGMAEETEILADYAKRSGNLRLFDAYIQLGREVADEWDVRPESVFGQVALSYPQLLQKLSDIDKENFKKENEEWLKKHSSKKVKSSNKIIKEVDESSMEELEKYAKECGDEIWSLFNGSLVHLLAYFQTENNTYKVLYIPITYLRTGTGETSYLMLTKDEDYKFYSECDEATSADFSSLELLPGDDTYEHIGFVRNSSIECLNEFLDGPRYSKEIKIEAGLIKNGLVKYAGFDFNRGTKYSITEKGLKILHSAAEKEHNEALNEREKLAYLFGFNTDKETTLDTTGKTIKADDKDIIVIDTGSGYLQVFENKDTYTYGGHNVGEQLYQFDIDDESKHNGIAVLNVDDMISKDFYTITFENFDELEEFVWKLKEATTQKEIASLLKGQPKKVDSSKTFTITEADGCELGKVTASSQLDALVKFGIEHPEYADSRSIKAEDLYSPNHKDPKLGITIREEERLIKKIAKDYEISEEMAEFIFGGLRGFSKDWKINEQHIEIIAKDTFLRPIDIELIAKDFGFKTEDKKIDAQYEQTTNTKEPYPNPSETPTTDVILENHDGWVNTANKK